MPEPMTEKVVAKSIRAAALECGWKHFHPWLSIHSARGWPDDSMVRNGVLFLWELKGTKGKVSESQQAWIDALAEVPGVDCRVIWPSDLENAYQALVTGVWPEGAN